MKKENLYPLSPERIGMSYLHILAILMVFFGHFGFAQNQPMLIKDLNVGTGSSNPQDFSASGNKLRFKTLINSNYPKVNR